MKSDDAKDERCSAQRRAEFPAANKIKSEYPSIECDRDVESVELYQKHCTHPDNISRTFHGGMMASESENNYFMDSKHDMYSYNQTVHNGESKMSFTGLQQLRQEAADRLVKAEIEQDCVQVSDDVLLGLRCNWKYSRTLAESSTVDEGRPELKIPRYTPARRSKPVNTFRCPSSHVNLNWTNPELSIPSSGGSTAINSVLKDVIERTISENFYTRRQLMPSEYIFNMNGCSRQPNSNETPSSDGGSLSSESSIKNARLDLFKSSPVNTSRSNSPDFEDGGCDNRSSDGSSDGEKRFSSKQASEASKKTRPKRGQYRKYNRQLLLEAVRAVQQGDMSVHRAGSYYGVPHSTLEYKVKERHLLRQKKTLEASERRFDSLVQRDENEMATNSATTETSGRFPPLLYSREPSDHSISSLAASSFQHPLPLCDTLFSASLASVAAVAATGTSLPHLLSYFRSSLPVGFGWPPMINSSYPFLSLPGGGMAPLKGSMPPCGSFGFGMSASDLLKRLQQKVQANSSQGGRDSMVRLTEMSSMDNGRLLASTSPDISNGGRSSSSAGSIESVSRLAVV